MWKNLEKQTRSRIMIIVLGVLFTAPVLTSALLVVTGWRPADIGLDAQRNYGQLVTPVAVVESFTLPLRYQVPPRSEVTESTPLPQISDTPTAAYFTQEDFEFQWTLLWVGGAQCGLDCQQRLLDIRAMTADFKLTDLTQRVTLLSEPPEADFKDWLQQNHLDAPIAVLSDASAAESKGLMQALNQVEGLLPNTLYLISPMGEIGLYWLPDQMDRKKILKEIKHLQKFMRGG